MLKACRYYSLFMKLCRIPLNDQIHCKEFNIKITKKKNIAYSILLVTHVVFKPSIPIWQECDFTLHHYPFVKHSRHPPNRETSNFLYQLCVSFKVIPILWAEKIPQTYLSNSKDLRSNFKSVISCALWISFKATPLL